MPRDETRAERLAYRWCAIACLGGIAFSIGDIWAELGAEQLKELGQHAAISLLFLGKFVIFSGVRDNTPSPWVLAIMVWLIDLILAFALLSGLESLERTPVFGRWLRRMRGKALAVITKYPGLERMAFFGVALFVMLPLAATGAVTGAFAARLTGLTRIAGVAAIALGSAGTATSFALLATFVGEQAEILARSPVLVGSTVAVLLIIGRVAYLRILGRLKRR